MRPCRRRVVHRVEPSKIAKEIESCEKRSKRLCVPMNGTQMLAFLVLFDSGLCGYTLSPLVCWPLAALGLMSVSLARQYALIRGGVEAGFEESVGERCYAAASTLS
jgi:hypothetical protein